MKTRVVIDARPLTHPQPGGFRTYVRSLLTGLRQRGGDDLEVVLYVDRAPGADDVLLAPEGAEFRVLPHDRLRADLGSFQRQVRRDRPHVVHGTVNYLPVGIAPLCALTVTIHDAMGVRRYPWQAGVHRNPRERFVNRYWAWCTRATARKARRIITVSQCAAADLQSALRITPTRLRIIYGAVSLTPPRPPVDPQRFAVTALASPDPRKNLDLLFDALKNHRSVFPADMRVALVCGSDDTARRTADSVKRSGVNGVEIVRCRTDDELAERYGRSGVLVWPSFREGFGLPPLEAMLCGCPVASSSAPAMPEVLGPDVPAYFDPDSAEMLAASTAALLCEAPVPRSERIRAGILHARQFTALRMAEETADVWHAAAGNSR